VAGKGKNPEILIGGKRPELEQPVELSENARTVLTKRYLRKGPDGLPAETVEEMFWRVAWNVAGPEEKHGADRQAAAGDFFRLLTAKRFFPNSPTFTGAGTPLGQLAACFVLGISDDMGRAPDGIFQTLRNAALIQQTGGGNGFSFSRLRPKGARVRSSGGVATGPVGFLRVYDQAFGEIAQGGSRRGASIGVLRVDHPDIRRFVTCKTDESAITNFNISVGITDAFMQAVRDDKEFDLVSPHDGSTWETVRARELFDLIVQQAYHNGEPGLLFLDAANRDNPVPHLYTLESTNPCLAGSTRIPTEFGLPTIEELAASGGAASVVADDRAPANGDRTPGDACGAALRPASAAWMTRREARVMRLTTKMGYSVTATPGHRFLTPRGYVELKDLEPGDEVLLQSGGGAWGRDYALPNTEYMRRLMGQMALCGSGENGPPVQRRDFQALYANLPERWSHDLGLAMGWLVGDGWLSEVGRGVLGMVFAKDSLLKAVHEPLTRWFGPGHVCDRGSHWQLTYAAVPHQFFKSLGVMPVHSPKKRVPASIWTAPEEAVAGFLRGLFSADGTVLANEKKQDCTVRLASSSHGLLRDVQVLLVNFGVASRIYTRREAGRRLMPDGRGGLKEYSYHTQYELVIGKVNRDRFAGMIGFIDAEKQARVEAFIAAKQRRSNREAFVDRVIDVGDAGRADVYDLSQPQTHSLIANGLVAHNCGEQFLAPNESCCLGSVNLAQHVTADDRVDWEKLRESVEIATRFLDNVVDANTYVPALPDLQAAAQRVRRIGLGIMGLGDMMYRLGVRYGSEEGQEFAAQMMEFVHYHAMRASVALAEARGPFPAIKGSVFDPSALTWSPPEPLAPYSRDWGRPALDWGAVVEGIRQHGIRNGAQTTIAPTGTISTVAGVEGYGCEPVFALAYVRYFDDSGTRRELQYTSPLFEGALIDAGLDEATRERIIKRVNQTGSCQDIAEVPEAIRRVFVVAGDISAGEHVRMQAAMQRFVSNAISKTCNFPSSATPDDVAKAYMLAWELGCKGLTAYVAGSREKVVLETAETARSREGADRDAPQTAVAMVSPDGKGDSPPAPATQDELPLFADEVKRPRARVLPGYTYRVKTPLGTAFVTVNQNGHGRPFEVFVNTAKAGSETAAHSEAIGRLISYILRMNSPVDPRKRLKEVARQLEGIGGGRSLGLGPNRVRSLPDGIAQVLVEHLAVIEEADEDEAEEAPGPAPGQMSLPVGVSTDLCPECGQAALVNEEGCRKCYACGYSEC
jgi:ribonucleoside-diphosphate reductase alpha chain